MKNLLCLFALVFASACSSSSTESDPTSCDNIAGSYTMQSHRESGDCGNVDASAQVTIAMEDNRYVLADDSGGRCFGTSGVCHVIFQCVEVGKSDTVSYVIDLGFSGDTGSGMMTVKSSTCDLRYSTTLTRR